MSIDWDKRQTSLGKHKHLSEDVLDSTTGGPSGGLTITDGNATVEAGMLLTPAAPSGDQALLTIAPAVGATPTDVAIVVIDPGGDPADQFGIFEITVGGLLLLGSGGIYPIEMNQATGTIEARQLVAVSAVDEIPLTSTAKDGGGTDITTLSHLGVIPGFGDPYDGSLTFNAGVGTILFRITPAGNVIMPSLPTSNPNVAGSLWVDVAAGRVVKQSAG